MTKAIITVSEFARITDTKRDTIYSWIYRGKLPKGIRLAGIGKSKILEVSKSSDYFEMVSTELAKTL